MFVSHHWVNLKTWKLDQKFPLRAVFLVAIVRLKMENWSEWISPPRMCFFLNLECFKKCLSEGWVWPKKLFASKRLPNCFLSQKDTSFKALSSFPIKNYLHVFVTWKTFKGGMLHRVFSIYLRVSDLLN